MDSRKIIIGSYVIASMVAWFLARAAIQYVFLTFYQVRRMPGAEIVRESLPILAGLGIFGFLYLYPKVNVWMDEVVSEIKKVTWPGKEDVKRSTIVVIVCILICSVVLALFDLGWGSVIKYLLEA